MDGNAAENAGVAHKNDRLVVYRDNDGIVVFDYGTQIIDIEGAKRSNKLHRALKPVGPEPIMIIGESARGVRSEIVDYASSDEVVEITAASALVAKSKVAEVIGNVYMTFQKNPYPTRLFTDETKARAWLKEIVAKG